MKYRIPTVKEYLTLKYSTDIAETIKIAQEIAPEIRTVKDLRTFLSEYLSAIEAEKMSNPELNIPYYPEENERKQYYNCNTQDLKIVSDYTRLSFSEVESLDIFTFWGYLHDAAVWNCNKTESGREYLEKAYTHSQKEPDRVALRHFFGGDKHGK